MGNNLHEYDFEGAHKPCLNNKRDEAPVCQGENICALFTFCNLPFRLGKQTEKITSRKRKIRKIQLQIFEAT